MASTPFTLAALATSAVPGLEVSGTRPHTSGSSGAFTSAVLATDRGDVIVRVPASSAAEVQQSSELLGLAALADGARSTLPFSVPETLGMTRAGDTRAVVSTFLPGVPSTLEQFDSNAELLKHTSEAIAAIHSLPTGIVRDGGLPSRDANEVRMIASRLVQRAADTGMLPATVRRRWEEVLDSARVWSFDPIVVHGALAPELLLVEGGELSGILGWGDLSLGDPASDLAWLLDAESGTFEAALARYTTYRSVSGQHELTARARFTHELQVAKWLLHGFDSHDQSIVDDAVSMFDRLVDRLSILGTVLPTQRVLSEQEVERMLDETPTVEHDPRSETAEFESLDEDRAFGTDPDDSTDAGTDSDDSTHADDDSRSAVRSDHESDADPDAETGVLDDAVKGSDRLPRD